MYTGKAERLELWVFLPCPEDPGRAPKMIAYGERSQILDHQRRRFSFGTRDQSWSLWEDITQELLHTRVLLKYERDRESFWHRHKKGARELPPLLVLAKELYTFLIGYYNKSKECLKVVKIFQAHSHNLHFKITGLVRRFSRRRNCSQAGYIVVI